MVLASCSELEIGEANVEVVDQLHIETATDGGFAGHFRLQCPTSAGASRACMSRPGELELVEASFLISARKESTSEGVLTNPLPPSLKI